MVVRARQDATRYEHNVLSPQRQKTLLREAHVSPAWARLWHVAVPLQILVHLGKIRRSDGVKNIFCVWEREFRINTLPLEKPSSKKKLGLTAIVPGPTRKRTRLPNYHFYPFLFRYKSANDEMRTCTFPRGGHQLLFWGRVGLPSHKTWGPEVVVEPPIHDLQMGSTATKWDEFPFSCSMMAHGLPPLQNHPFLTV